MDFNYLLLFSILAALLWGLIAGCHRLEEKR